MDRITPRRKSGVRTFTDPRNPFRRYPSKHITRIEEVRKDKTRAGQRSQNAMVVPCSLEDQTAAQQVSHPLTPSDKPRNIPMSYAGAEGRAMLRQWPRSWEGAAEQPPSGVETVARLLAFQEPQTGALASGRACGSLETYLSDMRRSSRAARRPAPEGKSQHHHGDRSGGGAAASQPPVAGLSRRARSLSHERGQQVQSHEEDVYGMARKGAVQGPWMLKMHGSGSDFLRHASPPASARASLRGGARSPEFQSPRDKRFEEVVAHMRSASPEQKAALTHLRARGASSALVRGSLRGDSP